MHRGHVLWQLARVLLQHRQQEQRGGHQNVHVWEVPYTSTCSCSRIPSTCDAIIIAIVAILLLLLFLLVIIVILRLLLVLVVTTAHSAACTSF